MPTRQVAIGIVLAIVAGSLITADSPCSTDGCQPSSASRSSMAAHDVVYSTGRTLDVYVPPAPDQQHTTVVLLHGCCGDRTDMVKLAEALAERGAVVFNADWGGIGVHARWPDAYQDVQCAFQYARARTAEFGGADTRVILVGWSDGAMVATTTGLRPFRQTSMRCAVRSSLEAPAAVVGIAGFYGWTIPPDPASSGPAAAFLGGDPTIAAPAWSRATPYGWLSYAASAPPLTMIVDGTDTLRADNERFAQAYQQAGGRVTLTIFPASGDPSLLAPRTNQARQTVIQVLRAADPQR